MKKYFTLFSVIALFFVGMQFSSAQEKKLRPEDKAKITTHEIHQLVTLTGKQQGQVFKVLVDTENDMSAIQSNAEGQDIHSTQKSKAAIMDRTNTRLKTILSPEQYMTYMKSLEVVKEEK